MDLLWGHRKMLAASGLIAAVSAGITLRVMTGHFNISMGVVDRAPQCSHWSVLRCSQLLGVPVSMDDLLRRMPPEEIGHSLLQVSRVLHSLGIYTEGRHETWKKLMEYEMPCIAHLNQPDHYVTISSIDPNGRFVHTFDGDGRRTRWSQERFRKRWSGTVLCVTGVRDRTGANANSPRVRFDHLLLDKGEVAAAGKPVEFDFPFRNDGGSDLIIEDVQVSCGCVEAERPDSAIAPGETANLKLVYTVEHAAGIFSRSAVVHTNDPNSPDVLISMTGFCRVDVKVVPPRLTLRDVIVNRQFSTYLFLHYSGESKNVHVEIDDSKLIGAVVKKHLWREIDKWAADKHAERYLQLATSTREHTQLLELVMQASGDVGGVVRGSIEVQTDVPGFEEIVVPVVGNLEAPVKAFPRTIVLDAKSPILRTRLVSLTGEPFRIRSVTGSPDDLLCRFEEAIVKETTLELRSEGCHALEAAPSEILVNLELPGTGECFALALNTVARSLATSGAR